MACTIFYEGKLKNESTFQDVLFVVKKHSRELDCTIKTYDSIIDLRLNTGSSEPLILTVENGRIDGFCKWNGDSDEEYYKVLDIFIDLKPLFKSLKVEDDCGEWHSYLIRSKPCKIVKRTDLTKQEEILLQRMINSLHGGLSDIEREAFGIMFRYNALFIPTCSPIMLIIIQDFIKVCNLESFDGREKKKIVNRAGRLEDFNEHFCFCEANFIPEFRYIVTAVWISNCLSYKDKGLVIEVVDKPRGFAASKLAAVFGIMSGFMNCHSGLVNAKHAEINKFIEKNTINQVNPVDIVRHDLELLVSILDYLGFKYVGVSDSTKQK